MTRSPRRWSLSRWLGGLRADSPPGSAVIAASDMACGRNVVPRWMWRGDWCSLRERDQRYALDVSAAG